jgi:hypothetical protein
MLLHCTSRGISVFVPKANLMPPDKKRPSDILTAGASGLIF